MWALCHMGNRGGASRQNGTLSFHIEITSWEFRGVSGT